MQTLRRMFLYAAALLCASAALAGEPKANRDVRWARGVADDFWKAMQAGQTDFAVSLLSPELTSALTQHFSGGANYTPEEMIRWHAAGDWSDLTVSFDSERLAPDRNEVVFSGTLTGKTNKDGVVTDKSANFTMRVAKEPAGGKWSIRFLLVVPRANADGKEP